MGDAAGAVESGIEGGLNVSITNADMWLVNFEIKICLYTTLILN